MFGSILAMTKEDMALAVVLSLVVLGLFVICYNQMFAVTFDENFARATGVNVGFYNMVISVLTAVTIVLGMRMMGAMLISSLVIFPCLTSMRVFKSFGGVMISSGSFIPCVFPFGNDGILPVFHTCRSQRGGGKSGGLCDLWRMADAWEEKIRVTVQPCEDSGRKSVESLLS